MATAELDNNKLSCSHFVINKQVKESLLRIANHAAKVQGRCTVCRTPRAVWCCLQCYHIGCGRYEKKHALKHAQESQHFICVNMESPKHLWCYKCDQPIVYFGDKDKQNNALSNNNNNNNNNDNYFLDPKKWKSAESILKSTPIWHESMNGGMCGMQNLGNTCFMNASLQALLHCPAVVYLFTLPEILYIKKYNRLRLVEEFVKLTHEIWEGKHRNVIPRDMLRCIMYKYPQFRGYGQQDAHEFLTCLLQFLHDEYKYKIPKICKEEEEEEEEETDNNNNNNNEKKENNKNNNKKKNKYMETSIIYDLFSGEIISSVECLKCNTKSKKIESLTNIQVEIPKQEAIDRCIKERTINGATALPTKSWMSSVFTFVGLQTNSIPLSLCLHSYCTSEDLLNNEKYYCDKCKLKQNAKKTLLIKKLPEILMIQIKRFSHDSFWRGSSKISTHVSFPIDSLDLKQYMVHNNNNNDDENSTKYDLCSIIKHMGSTNGGHYISFCKHPATAKWYKFDDSRVEEITREKLSEQQAYILFYIRRKYDRSTIKSISNVLSIHKQLSNNHLNNQQYTLLSRYWLHKIQAFSKPGPIDNLWLSCYHGYPLSYKHNRIKYCSIKIPYNIWLELTKKYGVQYNTKMLIYNKHNINNNNEMSETKKPWELTEKSLKCKDCKFEELNKRRDYEKQEIRRLEDDGCPQDCALNMKWANQWRNFVHNKTNIIPSPIDNAHIHAGNNMLKEELIKDTDYLMIPSKIWTFLIEMYGGGPKIVLQLPVKIFKKYNLKVVNKLVNDDIGSFDDCIAASLLVNDHNNIDMVANKVMEMKHKQAKGWKCSICTFLNTATSDKCEVCRQGERPNVEVEQINENIYEQKENEIIIEQKHTNLKGIDNMEQESIRLWLQNKVGLPQYFVNFMNEGYDSMITIIETVNERDLLEIGVNKKGHRKKIMLFINIMRKDNKKNNKQDGNECIICWENKANMFNYPCGHVTYCGECSIMALQQSTRCPNCREEIECRRIYNAGFQLQDDNNNDEHANDDVFVGTHVQDTAK